MSRKYEKPEVEIVSFEMIENQMDTDPELGGSLVGGEDNPLLPNA